MTAPSPLDIIDRFDQRESAMHQDHRRWNTMVKLFEGQHHELFPEEFHDGEVAKLAGFIRRTWRMLTRMVGKVPDIQVFPLSLAQSDKDRADLVEKICFHYNDVWSMKRRMQQIAHFYIGMGAFAAGIVPDMNRREPMLLVEDPRNVFPGASWESTSPALGSRSTSMPDVGAVLEDCIIRKNLNGRQLRKMFPYHPELLDRIPDTSEGWNSTFDVIQYYDDVYWKTVLRDGGTVLTSAEHEIGWCPWVFGTIFSSGQQTGTSDLEQQIGLEIAFMRVLDQKLAINDSVAWPWLFTRGYVEEDPERRLLAGGSADAAAEFLVPAPQFQVDRDMAMIRDLLRTLNFETEVSQGEVTGGPITGRGVVELSRVVVDTVQSFFDDFAFYLPRLYVTALSMDQALWTDETKHIAGRGRGEEFFAKYRPGKDIGDAFGRPIIDFGPGLGDFESSMQMLQHLGAESVAVDTIMEKNPLVRSVSNERRKILINKAREILFGSAMMGETVVPFEWLAGFIKAMEDGQEPEQWILDNPPGPQTPQLPPELAGAVPPGGAPGSALPPPGQGAAPGELQGPPAEQILGALMG